jgi:type VI secretion system protein ImpH
MAGTLGATAADLKAWVVREARSLAFFQAIRLLRLATAAEGKPAGRDFDWKGVRVRANLSLAFPEYDIEALEPLPDSDAYRITANFFGLYGVSSPLPTFYTEDLMEEAGRDASAQRDFIDIFHFALYPLMYDAWGKYANMHKVVEEGDIDYLNRLYALVGFCEPAAREGLPYVHGLLRYAGLLTQFPRSALGLKTLLSDAIEGVPVEIESCVPAKLRIPTDQQACLGGRAARLGQTAFLGQEIDDRMSSITIRVGPVDEDEFQRLLPFHPEHNRLRFLVRMYLVDPLRSNVELILKAGKVKAARLGGDMWNQLGLDTWCFAGGYEEEVRVTFALYK